MKQRQDITTVRLRMARTDLSPVMAADAGKASGGERIQPDQRQFEISPGYQLSLEQMDKVSAGAINPFWSFMFWLNPDAVASAILNDGLNIYD